MINTQRGITQPVSGQDKEEPELWQEDDIPGEPEGRGRAADAPKTQNAPKDKDQPPKER